MAYVKELLTAADMDQLRVNLSRRKVKLSPDPVCDFCGDTHPVWRYAATRMSTGEWQRCWRWLACGPCSNAVDSGDWLVVGRRVRKKLRTMVTVIVMGGDGAELFTEPILTASVRAVLREFHEYAEQVAEVTDAR